MADEKLISRAPYVYSVDVPALAAGETWTGHFTIQPDSHFLAIQRVMKVRPALGGATEGSTPVPNATVQIRDAGSGRLFMREPVQLSCVFGSGHFPYHIPLGGKLFYKRQVIEVTVTAMQELGTLGAMSLEWQGEKLFTTGG